VRAGVAGRGWRHQFPMSHFHGRALV
jgi:hypothetical protein